MRIIPVQPDTSDITNDETTDAAGTSRGTASRRTFGRKVPSRRTFGRKIPWSTAFRWPTSGGVPATDASRIAR